MIVGNRFRSSLVGGLVLLAGACVSTGRRPEGFAVPQPIVPEPAYINPGNVPGLDGFSQAVKVGPNLYISGEVSLDSLGRMVGAGDLRAQMTQALGNLERVIRQARGTPSDLIRVNIFIVHPTAEDYRTVFTMATDYFTPPKRPTVNLIGIESLPMPGLMVSIDGQALIRAEFPEKGAK